MLLDDVLLRRAKQKFGKRKLSEAVNGLLENALAKKMKKKDAGGILRHLKLPPFERDEDREL